MAAVKIIKFLGEAPKISPELLPDSAAQIALNVKLYSGDLIPYRIPVIVDNAERSGNIGTLHALRDPDTDQLVWLSWAADVDIVTASASEDQEQRFYYTGDGKPKVSNYDLATTGSEPYPVSFYELGLPLPETKVTTTAASFSNKTSSTRARDAGNIATIVTSAAHGLRTGNYVTVSGFPAATSTVATFNATNAQVTVVNDTTFTYYSPGETVSTTSDTSGTIALAGNTFPRSYVYTWYTPWEEESIASEPSENLYIKEGQTVTVANLPTARPAGDNFIRGIRLYRTLASSSGTRYYRLKTLWFPISTMKVSRAGNVSRITMNDHHNLAIDDRFKISGCTDTSFNVTDGIITDVIDQYTFEFSQTAADVAEKTETTGTLYHDCAETTDKPARYWGDSSFNFTDDFDSYNLFDILDTEDYDAPPENLQGLTAVQNNILIGFVGNQLYFSEPGIPHAWPAKYALTFEADIVGVASVSGYILVLTEEYPYQISGNNPATMAFARIDTLYPCLSKRSIVNMGYGAAYATHGGIAVYAPARGMDLITKYVHDWDTWESSLDPSTVVAKFYNGKYFASHSTGSFMFERDEKIGGFFVQINYKYSAAWSDPRTNTFYYVGDSLNNIYEWDRPTQPLSPMEWKSKVITTKDYLNLGAARVVADYEVPDEELQAVIDYNNAAFTFNAQIWADNPQLGTINGPTDHLTSGSIRVENHGEINTMQINGDPLTRSPLPIPGILPMNFRVWVDKNLIFQGSISNSDIFRLPSGYRSDTFEVAVSGSARVRSIHIGETPYGLRTA